MAYGDYTPGAGWEQGNQQYPQHTAEDGGVANGDQAWLNGVIENWHPFGIGAAWNLDGFTTDIIPTNQPNAQNQQMKQVRPTYESNSLADLYNKPDYTQQAWNPYGYDYAPPSYNPNDMYGFGQTDAGQDTYGM